ncbi:hypothetical protein REPUB_Repub19eG0109300 [Reevesia pubescens]
MYFVSLMKEDRLVEILDPRMLKNENVDHEQLNKVVALAWRCVRVKEEESAYVNDATSNSMDDSINNKITFELEGAR